MPDSAKSFTSITSSMTEKDPSSGHTVIKSIFFIDEETSTKGLVKTNPWALAVLRAASSKPFPSFLHRKFLWFSLYLYLYFAL